MAGVNIEKHGERKKRSNYKQSNENSCKVNVDENSPIIKLFRDFQTELDARHDKYERLVKISRDITIESKRTIFLLHRYRDAGPSVGARESGNEAEKLKIREEDEILNDANQKLKDIQTTKFRIIAEELLGEDPNQFMRAISPGLQEYIEGLSFYHYLKYGRLVSLQEVRKDLIFMSSDDESLGKRGIELVIPPVEYLLGIADLSGELMRLAINHVGAGNLDLPYKVCEFLQMMHDSFNSYGGSVKDLNKKMGTLRQSLRKVENACYTLHVRGSEIPKHMLADVLLQSGDKFTNEAE